MLSRVAAYGKYAIPALFATTESGATQAVAGENGLRALILSTPVENSPFSRSKIPRQVIKKDAHWLRT